MTFFGCIRVFSFFVFNVVCCFLVVVFLLFLLLFKLFCYILLFLLLFVWLFVWLGLGLQLCFFLCFFLCMFLCMSFVWACTGFVYLDPKSTPGASTLKKNGSTGSWRVLVVSYLCTLCVFMDVVCVSFLLLFLLELINQQKIIIH